MNRSNPWGKIIGLLTVVLSGFPLGCSSIRSTMFAYDGCQDCERVKKHLHGVPTTLAVPTHLQVTVTRTRWGRIDLTGAVVFVPDLETQEVNIAPIVLQEIFTVDFKRPASGTLSYKLTFDKDKQYITGIQNELEDTTIKDVAGLVAAVINAVPTRTLVRDATPPAANLLPFCDVIASEVFAISEPELQNRVEAFLAAYVNDCAPKCPEPCPFPGPSPRCAECAAAVSAFGVPAHPVVAAPPNVVEVSPPPAPVSPK